MELNTTAKRAKKRSRDTASVADGSSGETAETGSAAVPSNTAGSEAAQTLSKQERKRVKKKRQKEKAALEKVATEATEPSNLTAGQQPAAAAAVDAQAGIDDIFSAVGASRHESAASGPTDDNDDLDADSDEIEVQEGDDLAAIFAKKRRAVSPTRPAESATEPSDGEWSYVAGSSSGRRTVDGLPVYTEDEFERSALENYTGGDGPCPFDCRCCF